MLLEACFICLIIFSFLSLAKRFESRITWSIRNSKLKLKIKSEQQLQDRIFFLPWPLAPGEGEPSWLCSQASFLFWHFGATLVRSQSDLALDTCDFEWTPLTLIGTALFNLHIREPWATFWGCFKALKFGGKFLTRI